jgi:hypothetical protein
MRRQRQWHVRGVSVLSTITERSGEGARTPARRGSDALTEAEDDMEDETPARQGK